MPHRAPPAVTEALNKAEDQGLETCLTCPKLCRWACPVAETEARESTSPHSLVVLGGLLKKKRIEIESVRDFPYHCSDCGACTEACLHHNDVPLLLSMARQRVLKGHAAPTPVEELCGHFGVSGTPQGEPLDHALTEVTARAGKTIERDGCSVYIPGCTTLEKAPEVAVSFLRGSLLLGLEEVTTTPLSGHCCGLPLFWAGELEAFHAHAKRYAKEVEGIERLVVHEPSCLSCFLHRYPQFGVPLSAKVEHVADFVTRGLKRGHTEQAGTQRMEPSIAVDFSCHLKRSTKSQERAQRLITQLLGYAPSGEENKTGMLDCCGASGLLPLAAPETARAMARERIRAFRSSGKTSWLMFSPQCEAHLKTVDPSLPLLDLATLLEKP